MSVEKKLVEKILIAGTGRCGTTFLMQLLSALGLPTGYSRDTISTGMYGDSNGGLEGDLCPDGPMIVKNPDFYKYMHYYSGNYKILHVLLPLREFSAAVKSRCDRGHRSGGFIGGASTYAEQAAYNAEAFYKLVYSLMVLGIPYTLMEFPRIVAEPHYCFCSLSFLMKLFGVELSRFVRVHKEVADPSLVHY